MFFVGPVGYRWGKRKENVKPAGSVLTDDKKNEPSFVKISPVQEVQAYLECSASCDVDERILLGAVRAAHDSIEGNNKYSDTKEIFEILLAIIQKCKTLPKSKSLFLYQDQNKRTVLHQLILFGDKWQHITEQVLLAAPELCDICDGSGRFPVALAADVRAFDTLMLLESYNQPKEAWLQYLQAPYQKEIEHGSKQAVERFIEENPYPDKVRVPFLIAKHNDWKNAYSALKKYIARHKGEEVITLQEIKNFLKCIFRQETNIGKWCSEDKGVIYLLILVSEPAFFIEYLLSIYSKSRDLRLDLVVFLLRNKEFATYIKEFDIFEQLQLLRRLAEFCDVPALEALNNNLLLDENHLEILEMQIEKWGPEKIIMDVIINLFKEQEKELVGILQQEPQGLSEEKIVQVIEKVPEEQLLARQQNGKIILEKNIKTILHVISQYGAGISARALLQRIPKEIVTTDVPDDSEMVKISYTATAEVRREVLRELRLGDRKNFRGFGP